MSVHDMREQIEAAVAAENFAFALHSAEALWVGAPTLTTAGYLKKVFAPVADKMSLTRKRVDVFRSYTIETVAPLLEGLGLVSRFLVDIRLGQYNAYVQDLMNAEAGADAALVALHPRTAVPAVWARGLADEMSQNVDWLCENMRMALEAYRSRVATPVALQLLEAPLIDASADQLKWIEDANSRLKEIVDAVPDCHAFGTGDLAQKHGVRWQDERNWTVAKVPFRNDFAGEVATRIFQNIRPAFGAPLKVLVVDLDNTLWGGVLGEDGHDGLTMAGDTGFQRLHDILGELKRRGILLAIASKNDEVPALASLNTHSDCRVRQADFAAFQINWQPKSGNIKLIADELGLGLDSIAFLDDNPVERAEVARALPMVRVLPHFADANATANMLAEHPEFARHRATAEDAERTALYAARRERQGLESQAGSREAFLASLQQEIIVEPLTDDTFVRIADLERKTNQFNVRTRRFSETELRQFAAGPDSYVMAFRVRDRFGDNGIVGLACVSLKGASATLENLLMSCRVIGRNVEHEMLKAVAKEALVRGYLEMEGTFSPTAKNGPSKDFYPQAGFDYERNEGDVAYWRRSVAAVIGG